MILISFKKSIVKGSTYTTKKGTVVVKKTYSDKRTKKSVLAASTKNDKKIESQKRADHIKSMFNKFGLLNIMPGVGIDYKMGTAKDSWVLKFKSPKTGKTVHAYSKATMDQKSEEKFNKIRELGKKIPLLRAQLNNHLSHDKLTREKVIATIVRLIDKTYIRIGTEKNVGHGVYGITTLRSNHVTIDNDQVTLKYVGKHKIEQEKIVVDKEIADILRELKKNIGGAGNFFSVDGKPVTSNQVNKYLKNFNMTAKQFRTFHASREMKEFLDSEPRPQKQTEAKLILKKGVAHIASKLGNTPAIAQKSYILPEIINDYAADYGLKPLAKSVKAESWSNPELTDKEKAFFNYLDQLAKKNKYA